MIGRECWKRKEKRVSPRKERLLLMMDEVKKKVYWN
jgi:hypothetical protein